MARASAHAAGTPWWDVSLTSAWLIVALTLLTLGATVAAAVTWDVARWKRTRRALLLVTAQVLTAVTIASAANVAGGFYGSLGDLLGGRHPAGPVVRAGDTPGP